MIKMCHLMPVNIMAKLDLEYVNDFIFIEAAWWANQAYQDLIKDTLRLVAPTTRVVIDNSVHLLKYPVLLPYLDTIYNNIYIQDKVVVLPDVKGDVDASMMCIAQCIEKFPIELENCDFMFVLQGKDMDQRREMLRHCYEVLCSSEGNRFTIGIPYIGYTDEENRWVFERLNTFTMVMDWLERKKIGPDRVSIHLLGTNGPEELSTPDYHKVPYNIYNDTSAAYAYAADGKTIQKNWIGRISGRISAWSDQGGCHMSYLIENIMYLNNLALG